VVLKLGGELLETADRLKEIARVIAAAARTLPLVVVHGGGREIDAALAQAGLVKQQVDGLRITDAATLAIVVAVLAGSINTRLVAAINAVGGRAVGLTGADAGVAPVRRAPPYAARSGARVDLGLVGQPTNAPPSDLIASLTGRGFVPVVASISAARDGALFNVNADTLAGSLAARLGATRLVMAGATPGVLDASGATLGTLDRHGIERLVASGTASAGMVAKLEACETALERGVSRVAIVDGRDGRRLARALRGERSGASTEITT
jgi:acetylglutamate kinase